MDIITSLIALINNQDQFGVKELGTFQKIKVPGRYNEEIHAFVPPSYQIKFTADRSITDDFICYVANENQIDQSMASKLVQNFVQDIHAQIAANQIAEVPGLGLFKLQNDQLQFFADENLTVNNEFYGLPPVITSAEVHPSKNTEDLLVQQQDTEVFKPIDSISETITQEENASDSSYTNQRIGKPFTPYFEDDEKDRTRKKFTSILLKIVLALVIIVACVGLAYFFYPHYFEQKFGKLNQEVIVLDTPKIDTNLIAIDTTGHLKDTSTLDSSLVLVKDELTTEPDQITYEIIGSAERSQKRIDHVINSLKNKGIEAKALPSLPGKLVKISLGSFTDLVLAKKVRDSLQKKLNNPQIYIQTIKPKK